MVACVVSGVAHSVAWDVVSVVLVGVAGGCVNVVAATPVTGHAPATATDTPMCSVVLRCLFVFPCLLYADIGCYLLIVLCHAKKCLFFGVELAGLCMLLIDCYAAVVSVRRCSIGAVVV
jgi:hypothetical protein